VLPLGRSARRGITEAGDSFGGGLYIAAVSIRYGERLLTKDRAFSRAPGLAVETYSIQCDALGHPVLSGNMGYRWGDD